MMDNFTKVILAVAMIGSVICAGVNASRDRKEVELAVDRQAYDIEVEAAEVKDFEDFCFGSPWAHLEKEKEYIAWVTSDGKYIAENYYLGDHYSDPRLVIVRNEDTGDVVQVFTTASYEKRSEIARAAETAFEVPD